MSTTRENSELGKAWHSHVAGRDDSAVGEFEKLVEQSPQDFDALYGLGLAYRGANQYAKSIEIFKRLEEMLEGEKPADEDDFNRLEMLKRMVNQQIHIVKSLT
ncbi:MAG: tetratricopeptide repeat protein [Anaerolineae bacterium]|nr:tetratricopeptide repeat protein [Anaerolineae bacterium]